MNQANDKNQSSPESQPTEKYDVIIIGAGIFGLWAARHALKAGLKTLVCEKRNVGWGASGGFLGALMPHMPDVWYQKKQMQFEALISLKDAINALEAETGMDCGYRMCGRLMPLPHEQMLLHMDQRIEGAKQNWTDGNGAQMFEFSHLRTDRGKHLQSGWLSPDLATFGVSYDAFSARVDPRAYIDALAHYVREHGTLLEETEVGSIDPVGGLITLTDGRGFSCDKIFCASGFEAYPFLQPYVGPLNADRSIGRGVKGQAVMVAFEHDDDLPIVYHDRAYVVPQSGNRVAIGSTSRSNWSGEPNSFDDQDMEFYERAIEMVPAIKNAPIVDKWAAVRPRNTLGDPWLHTVGTEPFVGLVPGYEKLFIAIGGFKISFGIAHEITKGLFS